MGDAFWFNQKWKGAGVIWSARFIIYMGMGWCFLSNIFSLCVCIFIFVYVHSMVVELCTITETSRYDAAQLSHFLTVLKK